MIHDREKSDSAIVAMKPTNKAVASKAAAAESVELSARLGYVARLPVHGSPWGLTGHEANPGHRKEPPAAALTALGVGADASCEHPRTRLRNG